MMSPPPRGGLQLLATAAPQVPPSPSADAAQQHQQQLPAVTAAPQTQVASSVVLASPVPATAFSTTPTPQHPPQQAQTPDRRTASVPDTLKVLWTPSTTVPDDSSPPKVVKGIELGEEGFEATRAYLLRMRASLGNTRPFSNACYSTRQRTATDGKAPLQSNAGPGNDRAAADQLPPPPPKPKPAAAAVGSSGRGGQAHQPQQQQRQQPQRHRPQHKSSTNDSSSVPSPAPAPPPTQGSAAQASDSAGALLLGILHGNSRTGEADNKGVPTGGKEGAELLKMLHGSSQKDHAGGAVKWEDGKNGWGSDKKKWQQWEESWETIGKPWKQWDDYGAGNNGNSNGNHHNGWRQWSNDKRGTEVAAMNGSNGRRREDGATNGAVAANASGPQSRVAIRQAAAAARRSQGRAA
mmetsp:Transcript_71050/g.184483  ORF Transcript_71050/g.184483 Transcript_71050/m.184483 type:complete len:408 (-) Transcript_71050:70-1293(-)